MIVSVSEQMDVHLIFSQGYWQVTLAEQFKIKVKNHSGSVKSLHQLFLVFCKESLGENTEDQSPLGFGPLKIWNNPGGPLIPGNSTYL